MGHYRIGALSGLITGVGVVANSPLFAFNWTPAAPDDKSLCLVPRFTASASVITAFGSPQEFGLQAFVARAITGSASGGTAVTLTTNNGKMRTVMGTSLMADMRIAGTSLLTAGAWALDATPIAVSQPALSTAAPLPSLSYLAATGDGEHPLTFATGEGLVICNTIAFTATGTVRLAVNLEWCEVPNF